MRSNYIYHAVHRSNILTPQEKALLNYVNSYSNYCRDTLAKIAEGMGRSRRMVQYLIDSLVKKGFLSKKYTIFKKMILTIVPIDIQEKLLGLMPKAMQKLALKYDVQKVARPYVQRSAHSIQKTIMKEKKINNLPNYYENKVKEELDSLKHDEISEESQSMLERFYANLK